MTDISPASADRNSRIRTWLQLLGVAQAQDDAAWSASPSGSEANKNKKHPDDDDIDKPCPKRIKYTKAASVSERDRDQAVFPCTPPVTTMSTTSSAQSLKRRHPSASRGTDGDGDVFVALRLPSPTKRPRSVSPKKNTRGILPLANLEKPVSLKAIGQSAHLPEDVKSLYNSILRISDYKLDIIPNEVFEQVRTATGDLQPDVSRRKDPTPCAQETLDKLQEIRADTEEAMRSGYLEAGWNACVHGPLLKMIFPTTPAPPPPAAESQQPAPELGATRQEDQPTPAPRVRLVPVMSAGIHSTYLPKLRPRAVPSQRQPPAGPALGGMSLAQASDAGTTTTNTGNASDAGGDSLGGRSDTKRVDYVLSMEPAAGSPLATFLEDFLYNEIVDRQPLPQHINQTLYGPLQKAPIACSIETKLGSSAPDPMLQLGIWIAAWHMRMESLRQFLFEEYPNLRDVARQHDRLPTALLIEVVNQEWWLYFACDRSAVSAIDVVGPQRLGSTADLLGLYALSASLKVIKRWVETEFRRGIERWFLLDEPGVTPSAGQE